MREEGEVRALLVEDDDEDAVIFCRHAGRLTQPKLAVTRATSEEEAIARLGADQFYLVFVDFNLAGGGSGRVLVRMLGLFKLGLTGAAIAAIFHWNVASPLGLILGLSALPLALLFDIFIFPVNKGAEKEI